MINADISNVWGDVALRDLLELAAGIFAAHRALTEGTGKGKGRGAWLDLPAGEPNKLILLAEKICLDSDVLVVIGDSAATLGIRAVMELLQGPHRNLGLGRSDPQILFIGENLSALISNDS